MEVTFYSHHIKNTFYTLLREVSRQEDDRLLGELCEGQEDPVCEQGKQPQ